MAIVSNVPFLLKTIRSFPVYKEDIGENYFENEKDVWETDDSTLSIEENEEVSIVFNADDQDAKLYLNELDIPHFDEHSISEDDDGHFYIKPSEKSFYLYRNEAGFDELRVDEILITIVCDGKKYYGKLRVLPKPVSLNEWYMMRDDIEAEMRGLSQDLIKKNIGLGGKNDASFSPKLMYDFLVIEKYSNKILPALIDISDNPRYEIRTYYDRVSNSKDDQTYDSETIKKIVKKAGSDSTISVPRKKAEYDIQDNRILKMILMLYEKKLEHFISVIENWGEFSLLKEKKDNKRMFSNPDIVEFKSIAIKLKKITSIIKTKEWYGCVKVLESPYIPHSLIMDTRYNTIYQMYQELRREDLKIEIDSKYSFTWKRSSLLYEIWCYFRLCRILLNDFDVRSEKWNISLESKFLFPFLESGTRVLFSNDKCIIDLIYNKPLPYSSRTISLEDPIYIAKRTDASNHNRPDILMNVYSSDKKIYIGSLIFECKYRKLSSFWNGGERSSRGQLESYYNNARSPLLYKGIGEELNMRPVNKVVALTPDNMGDGKEGKDFNIVVKAFKPGDNDCIQGSIKDLIDSEIQEMLNRYEKLSRMM